MRNQSRLRVLTFALLIAAFATACGQDSAVVKKEHFDKGNQLFAQKKYREAEIEYRTAIQLDARYAEARVKLAESLERLGDSPRAMGEYIRAADLLPKDADVQVKAASYLLAAGQLEDASARAQRALQIKPTHLQGRILFAYATAGLKDIDTGAAQVEDLIRMDPSQPTVFAQLGRFRLAQGKVSQAEKAFRSAYELAPNSVETLLALSDFYMSTARPAEAEEWLRKAIGVAPKDPRANRMLAALYMQTHRLAEAEAPLTAYVNSTAQTRPRLVLADYYFATNRRDKARETLEKLKDDDLTFADARIRLSVMAFVNGKTSEATNLLDEVLGRDPQNARALTMKARYLLMQSQYDKALPLLKAAVDADANLSEAHYWLGVTYRALGDKTAARGEFGRVQALMPSEIGSNLQLSQLALEDGNTAAAVDLATRAVTEQPNSFDARLVQVDALIAKGDLAAALAEALKIAAAAPNLPQASRQLGRVYMRQRAYAPAEAALQKAFSLSNGAPEVLGELVGAMIGTGHVSEAQAIVAQSIKKDPKDPRPYIYSARIHQAVHDTTRAERALQEALKVDPANLEAYLELSRLYLQTKQLDAARAQLEAIVARSPKQVWAHTMVGITYELQGRRKEAASSYQKALDIDPRAAMAANNLAMIYADTGQDLGLALQLAQTAVGQLPDSAEANDTLGWVYLKRNLPSLAIPAFERSAAKDSDNPLYHYHLGLALSQTGANGRARSALQKAIGLGKPFDGIDEARRLLARM